MTWDLPKELKIGNKKYKIRDNCDYRVILDTIEALSDESETQQARLYCAMRIFFEDYKKLPNPLYAFDSEEVSIIQEVADGITNIMNLGEKDDNSSSKSESPKIIDWKKDFNLICPAVNRVLGYDVRDADKYTHWYTFIGAYGEIGGDCYFAHVVSIRIKLQKGKKLDENEKQFYKEHKKDIELSDIMSEDDRKWLDDEL